MRFACLFLFAFSGLAYSNNVTNIQDYINNANTVTMADGNLARVKTFTNVDVNSKTATAIIRQYDAANDSFFDKPTTLKLSSSKFNQYFRSCLRGPVACLAYPAVTYASIEALGWIYDEISGDLTYELPGMAFPGSNYEECPDGWAFEQFTTFEGNGYTNAVTLRFPHVNCVFDVRSSSRQYRIPMSEHQNISGLSTSDISALYTPQLPVEWTSFADFSGFEWKTSKYEYPEDGVSRGVELHNIYARFRLQMPIGVNPEPLPGTMEAVNPDMVSQIYSPETISIGDGLVPNIWEPIETVLQPDEDSPTDLEEETDPDPEPLPSDIVGGQPSEDDFVSSDYLDHDVINVSDYFSGESFVNSSCPEPFVIDMPNNSSFEISFTNFCEISSIIKNFIILAGMLTWLTIVWRGLNA